MAYFLRLIFGVTLLVAIQTPAFAFDAVKLYLVANTDLFDSPELAIQAYIDRANTTLVNYKYTTGTVASNPTSGTLSANLNKTVGDPALGVAVAVVRYRCYGKTTLYTSPYAGCDAEPPPKCNSGYVSGVTGSKYFGSDGSTDCLNNCTYSIAVDMCIKLANGQGACVGQYGNGTGASCSAATNNTAMTPEANCMSQGKSFISVGGVTSCVSAGSQGSQPVTTKNNSSSSSNSSTKDANGNPTGSSSSNSTTNSSATFNGDGTVVVVTTTEKTNPDGTKETKTDTKTVSQTSYCAENPTAAQCKAATDSDISGACDAVACKGDAIQCAMAKEQARRNCEWFKENADWKAKGEALTNGTDTTANPAEENNRTIVNLPTALDASSPIAASGIQDRSFSVFGRSYTLRLSELNPYLAVVGYVFMALAYMAAGRILAGAV